MGESAQQLAIVNGDAADEGAVAEIPQQEIKLKDFAPSITVIGPRNSRFEVASSAAANRCKWQIIVSKLGSVLEKKIDLMLKGADGDVMPDTLTLQRTISTASMLQEMSMSAFEGRIAPNAPPGNDFERFALGMVKAATHGAAQGGSETFNQKAARVIQMANKNGISVNAPQGIRVVSEASIVEAK